MKVSAANIKSISYRSPFIYRILRGSEVHIFVPDIGDRRSIIIPMVLTDQLGPLRSLQHDLDIHQAQLQQTSRANVVMRPIPIRRIIQSSLFSLNYLYALTIVSFLADLLGHINIDLYFLLFEVQKKHVIIAFVALILGSSLSAVTKQINYKNFSLLDTGNTVVIRNGIVDKAAISIAKGSVTGFQFSSNFGQRIMGLTSVKVIVSSTEVKEEHVRTEMLLPYQTREELAVNLRLLFSGRGGSISTVVPARS